MAYRMSLTLALMVGMLVLSVMPARTTRGDPALVSLIAAVPSLIQKLLHLVLYGVLAGLWTWTLHPLDMTPRLAGTCVLALTIGFGATMEWFQSRIPGRFGTWTDVGLNAIGAIMGLALAASLLEGGAFSA